MASTEHSSEQEPERAATAPGSPVPERDGDPLAQLAAPPVFVVGHPRSGTTWVYDLLVAHPEVAGVLESWLFSRDLGILPLLRREHWDAAELERQDEVIGQRVGLGALLPREELIAELRALAGRIFSRSLDSGHRFLVEKTPNHLTSLDAIDEVFPGCRVVHVVRDGRDVAVSWRAAGRTWANWSTRSSPYRQARVWLGTVLDAREQGAALGERYMEIRYEDLQSDPAGQIRRLFDFCGMPHDPALVVRVCESTEFGGNFQGGSDRFRRAGRVGDWRDAWGPIDVLRFWAGAGRGILELDYEQDLLWPLRAAPHVLTRPFRRGSRVRDNAQSRRNSSLVP